MKRREFIAALGGAAALPLAARAQQRERMRRIGVLLPAPRTIRNFRPASRRSCRGWSNWAGPSAATCGIDTRWATANAAEIRRHAAELVALAPDVILAHGGSTVGPLLQATRTVPIVFPAVVDPVGAGFVESLARPGGNATGFITFEYGIERKMAGTAQADRAQRDASGGPSESRHTVRRRPIRRQSRPWRRRSGWK